MAGPTPEIIPMTVDGDINPAVRRAAEVLSGGGVILYPTDTIYGLGCLATDEAAIRRIYELKSRPESNPSLVLVGSVEMVERFVLEVPVPAAILMKKFWPGPLTLLFRASDIIPAALTGDTGKIGIRLPAHMFCSRLAGRCDDAIVSTSANISGQTPSGDPAVLVREFGPAVDLIVDAGRLVSAPSTIADITGGGLVILREGAISAVDISKALLSGS